MTSSLPSPPFTVNWPSNGNDAANCIYAGDFFATWVVSPEQIQANLYRGPGLIVAAGYLRVLAAAVTGQAGATDAELLSWFVNEAQKSESSGDVAVVRQFIESFVEPALINCRPAVCQSFGWAGNADLAGIGVFVSYYIEATLATIFFAILLWSHWTKWGKDYKELSNKEGRLSHRLWGAFLTALDDLRLSVFVFSVAVMFASLKALVTAQDDPLSVTSYDITTAMLVTIISVCPATLLYCISEDGEGKNGKGENRRGRRVLHLLIVFVLWVVMLVIVNLSRRTDPSRSSIEAGSIGHPFEVHCPVLGDGYLEGMRILAVVFSVLVLVWLLYLGASKCLRRKTYKLRDRTGRHLLVGFATLALVAMWVFLAVFTSMRATIIRVAGDSDQSNEWGFGQIVALATWAPVVLNFACNVFEAIRGKPKPESPNNRGNSGARGSLTAEKKDAKVTETIGSPVAERREEV